MRPLSQIIAIIDGTELAPGDLRVLAVLVEAGRPLGSADMAANARLTAQNVSRAVKRLHAGGLVEHAVPDNEADWRINLYVPTTHGRGLYRRLMRGMGEAA